MDLNHHKAKNATVITQKQAKHLLDRLTRAHWAREPSDLESMPPKVAAAKKVVAAWSSARERLRLKQQAAKRAHKDKAEEAIYFKDAAAALKAVEEFEKKWGRNS